MSRNKIISENSYILTKYLSQVATLALHHAQCNLQPMVLYGTLYPQNCGKLRVS